MARPKPVIVRLHELTPGQHADFFALLAERNKNATRDGKPFYTCRFRDLKRTVSFMVWADGGYFDQCEGDWKVGQFFKIRGTFGEHERYGPQIDIQQIRLTTDADRAEGFDPAEFVESSRLDTDGMLAELRAEVEKHIADEPLRRLVLTILERHAEPLKRLPATQRHFYPFPGGLLEHTLSVTRSCIELAERYAARYPDLKPPLNRDVVTAGAVLHDMGRVLELTDDLLEVRRTPAGGLLGHLFLAQNLVRDTARGLGDVNPELLLLLEHIIISHLNHPEWGSPHCIVLQLAPGCRFAA